MDRLISELGSGDPQYDKLVVKLISDNFPHPIYLVSTMLPTISVATMMQHVSNPCVWASPPVQFLFSLKKVNYMCGAIRTFEIRTEPVELDSFHASA